MKFGIGQPVRRHEDLRLITGNGRYTDDITLPGMVHAVVLRSPIAHARIKRVEVAAARSMPGVLFVATGDDIRSDGLGDVPCMLPLVNRDGTQRHDTPRPLLAQGKVRHVGQPVALVVAETLAEARDAAEAIDVEYDPLPPVTDAKAATAAAAPQLFDHIPGNIVFDWDNDMGDAKAPTPLSPKRRASLRSNFSTIALWSTRWSRATRSLTTMRRAAARRCTPRPRVRISYAIRSPRWCSNCRRKACA
jgi:CO/xanthine dehydrogenase Mo-binding subunit